MYTYFLIIDVYSYVETSIVFLLNTVLRGQLYRNTIYRQTAPLPIPFGIFFPPYESATIFEFPSISPRICLFEFRIYIYIYINMWSINNSHLNSLDGCSVRRVDFSSNVTFAIAISKMFVSNNLNPGKHSGSRKIRERIVLKQSAVITDKRISQIIIRTMCIAFVNRIRIIFILELFKNTS